MNCAGYAKLGKYLNIMMPVTKDDFNKPKYTLSMEGFQNECSDSQKNTARVSKPYQLSVLLIKTMKLYVKLVTRITIRIKLLIFQDKLLWELMLQDNKLSLYPLYDHLLLHFRHSLNVVLLSSPPRVCLV